MDDGDAVLVGHPARGVEHAHAHAAQALRGGAQALRPARPRRHRAPLRHGRPRARAPLRHP